MLPTPGFHHLHLNSVDPDAAIDVWSERNSDAVVTVPINDHRAVLNVAQYEWPPRTLENPDRSPLREGSARLYQLPTNTSIRLCFR